MFFVRAAFWIFLILLLMPTNDKEKSDFYSAASRTISDLGGFCTRNPRVCDKTGALFETIALKVRTTVEMLEDMIQSGRRDPGSVKRDPRRQSDARGDLLLAPAVTGSTNTLRDDDRAPSWRGPGGV